MEPRPKMDEEKFCYLWHLFNDPNARAAILSEDNDSSKLAASTIHQSVRNPGNFANWDSPSEKPFETLLQLYRDWDIAFHLMTYSSYETARTCDSD